MPGGNYGGGAGSVLQRARAPHVSEKAQLRGGAGERSGGQDDIGQSGGVLPIHQQRKTGVSQLWRRQPEARAVCRIRGGNRGKIRDGGRKLRRHAHFRQHRRGRSGQGHPGPSMLLHQRAHGALRASDPGIGTGMQGAGHHRRVSHVRPDHDAAAHRRGRKRTSQQAGGALPRRDFRPTGGGEHSFPGLCRGKGAGF